MGFTFRHILVLGNFGTLMWMDVPNWKRSCSDHLCQWTSSLYIYVSVLLSAKSISIEYIVVRDGGNGAKNDIFLSFRPLVTEASYS